MCLHRTQIPEFIVQVLPAFCVVYSSLFVHVFVVFHCAHESACQGDALVQLLPWGRGPPGLCQYVLVPPEWGSVSSKLDCGPGTRLRPLLCHRLVSDPAVSGSEASPGRAEVPAASLVAGRTVHSVPPSRQGAALVPGCWASLLTLETCWGSRK